MMYNGLIFEGGGIKALAYVGALEVMYKYQDIYAMKYFGGTSAGSIIATLLASNHTLEEINDILFEVDWNKLKDGNFGFIRNTFRLFNKYGYHKGNYFEVLIDSILYKKFGIREISFEQMYLHTNNHLRMVGTNITKGNTIYMDHIYTPRMSVAKGVRISSCIPLLFKPVEIDNELYIDGGLIKNLDLQMFCEYNIECMAFDLNDNIRNQSDKQKSENILIYMKRIIKMMHDKANTNETDKGKTSVCVINENKIDFMNFKLTRLEKMYLKQIGNEEMKKCIYRL